jgi:uncharacterized PurR-regulated membrane protein YhhQ (DUF165 family)
LPRVVFHLEQELDYLWFRNGPPNFHVVHTGDRWARIRISVGFLLSELADLAVYTPLQRRGMVRAVMLSSIAGLVVDSIIFLWLAFGSLDFLAGQIIGKTWMVLFALPIVAWLRNRDRRVGMSS